jgi:hypothetical protein
MIGQPENVYAAPRAALEDEDPLEKYEAGRVWGHRVAAWILALVAMGVIASMTNIPAYSTGYMAPYIGVATLILVWLVGLVFGRKRARQRMRQAWVGLAIWIIAWMVAGNWMQTVRAREGAAAKAMADIARRNAQEMEDLANNKGPGTSPSSSGATTPPPSGAPATGQGGLMQRVQPVAERSQAKAMKEVREFTAWRDSLGLEKVMLPANLATPEGRKRAGAKMDEFLAGYEAYHKRMVALAGEHRAGLEAAIGDHPGRAEFMIGVDKSMKAVLGDYDAMLQIQQSIVSQAHEIIDFIGRHEVGYRDGKLIFANQADLDRFNRMAQNLDHFAQQEEAVTKRQLARLRSSADNIEKSVKN